MAARRLKKVLIANRGEIAIRIIRSLRRLGYSPVAIYSEADRNSLHVRMADEVYEIGPPPASESYLSIPRILEAARKSGASAIHPGYGFLAENASFAKAVERSGLTFVGPSSRSIAAMGDKIEARKRARRAGLPLLAASPPVITEFEAEKEAKRIGYPVLVKARAGGGGKGMRRVDSKKDLAEAFRLAESEAKKAFSDPTLYLEKCLDRPRHVEVQVFGDSKGRVLALGDRDCSIQRRHQKIIEEAPAPLLKSATREKMAAAACKIASAVNYVGAGTVEFLVDARENFFFLEMNTRLQVEHPVTEWITGLDLVEWQMIVAEGGSLPSRVAPELHGHAIEVRIYAEDPDNHFFPAPGVIDLLRWPFGPCVRVDSGVEEGSKISLFYDPLIAKISVWGSDRAAALGRLRVALLETRIGGLKNNLSLLRSIVGHPRFGSANVSTAFLREEGPFAPPLIPPAMFGALLAASALQTSLLPSSSSVDPSPWWLSGTPKEIEPT